MTSQSAWRFAYLVIAVLLVVLTIVAFTWVWWAAIFPAMLLLGWLTPGFDAVYMRARHGTRA